MDPAIIVDSAAQGDAVSRRSGKKGEKGKGKQVSIYSKRAVKLRTLIVGRRAGLVGKHVQYFLSSFATGIFYSVSGSLDLGHLASFYRCLSRLDVSQTIQNLSRMRFQL